MKNKQNLVKIALFSVVLMFLFLIFFSFLASAKEITVSNSEKADFTSIQEAVNNSASGDRILVSPGAYDETVKISVKNISILSKSEIPQDTFVKVFEIFANNVTIGGFTILENIKIRASIPYDGHNFYTVENCTIKYNQFLKDGIDASECYNATIKENTFLGKGIGSECYNCNFYDNVFFEGNINIHTYGDSTRNLIYNNTFLKGGIALADSDDNKIIKNRILNRIEDGNGIVLFESHNNFIDNNYISNCSCGILLPFLCGDNEVTNNTLISNNEGIKIDHLSPWNTFKNNTIANNNIGVSILNSCPGTLITENRIQFNRDYGIYIAQSSTDPGFNGTNLIYNNLFNNTVNFFNNTKTMQYGDPVTSIWNITKTSGTNIAGGPYLGGNYWAKPDGAGFSETCLDLNGDGICDLPYNISENDIDYLPLTAPHMKSADSHSMLTITQITTNKSYQWGPSIYGDWIVWMDNRNAEHWDEGFTSGEWGDWEIYVYNLLTKMEKRITYNGADQTGPRIYGDKILWTDVRNNRTGHFDNEDVYMYNLSTSTETQITSNESDQAVQGIYGDKIVWIDNHNGSTNWDIYMYDLSTSREVQITTNESNQYNAAIYGNIIVWEDERNGNGHDLYMYDLSTRKETRITSTGKAFLPVIYKDRIVWQDNRNGNYDLYMYDLSTLIETQLTNDQSNQVNPVIWEDNVVYMDDRNGGGWIRSPADVGLEDWQIYMYNLSTSKSFYITTFESYSYRHGIYENKIVWQDGHNGNDDIYLCTFLESDQ